MPGEKTRPVRRAAIGIAVLAGALLLAPTPALAAVTCDFTSNTLMVTVTAGTPFPTISHDTGPSTEIKVDDNANFGDGTLTCTTGTPTDITTSNIVVNEVGSGQGTTLVLDFARGRLEPGIGAETGTAEIELSYQADGDDQLQITAGAESANQSFQFGDIGGSMIGGDLNGDDDSDDATLTGVDSLFLSAPGTGDDTFTGDGSGSAAFTGPVPAEMDALESQGNDTFRSGNSLNTNDYRGGLGNDSVVGGTGPDSFHMEDGNDTFDGGGGNTDAASYENTASALGATLDLSNPAPQDTVGFGTDQVTNAEVAIGSNGPDRLTGTNGDNTLFGGNLTNDTGSDRLNGLGGNDTLPARAGNDSLIGGAGNDMLIGEAGSDTVSFALGSTGPVTFSLDPALTGVAQLTGGAGNDTLVDSSSPTDPDANHEVENLVGTPFGDMLTGNLLANRINVLDGILDTVDCVNAGDGDEAIADEIGVDMLANCETIDNAPQTSVTAGPASGATINDSTPTYSLSADEPASFQVRVDSGGFQACGASCDVPGLADGAHTLAFHAIDADENGSADQTPATRTVTIDATAPDTTVSGKSKYKTAKKSAPVSFTLSSSEIASLECSLDGGSFTPCTSPYSFRAARGSHTLAARATDALGNVDASPASFPFKVKKKKRKK